MVIIIQEVRNIVKLLILLLAFYLKHSKNENCH